MFGAVKLTKNVDFEKHKYCRYGIEFDPHGIFSLFDGSRFGKDIIILDVDLSMSSSGMLTIKERHHNFW